MHWSNTDGNTKSHRLSSRRVKSSRELYRPAITDLSEQAEWNSNILENNSISYAVTQISSERQPDVYNGIDGKQSETQKHPDTSASVSPLCLSTKLPNVYEDQYRQRVITSARHRQRLTNMKRAKSVEPSTSSPQTTHYSMSYTSNVDNAENNGDVINLLITNKMYSVKIKDEHVDKRKTAARIQSKGKSTPSMRGTLLSDGFKGQLSGYHHHLITTHPKTKQRISMWLTNGFKIQSFRSKNSRASTAFVGNGYDNKSTYGRKINDKKLIEDLKKIRLDENEDVVVYDNYQPNTRLFSARSVDIDSLSLGLMGTRIRNDPLNDDTIHKMDNLP